LLLHHLRETSTRLLVKSQKEVQRRFKIREREDAVDNDMSSPIRTYTTYNILMMCII